MKRVKRLNTPKISGKIVDIQPYEDEEGIFEQNVFIEMPEGTILKIFDPEIIVKKDMVGKTGEITVAAFLPQIQRSTEQKYYVKSDYSLINNKNWKPMYFEGKIEEFNEKRDQFILDFGTGLMNVDIHEFQGEGYKAGDFVYFNIYRIDLKSLYPDK